MELGQVAPAIGGDRGPHADHDEPRVPAWAIADPEAIGRDGRVERILETGLEDGDTAHPQHVVPVTSRLDDLHVVTQRSQSDPGDEADVARADDQDPFIAHLAEGYQRRPTGGRAGQRVVTAGLAVG